MKTRSPTDIVTNILQMIRYNTGTANKILLSGGIVYRMKSQPTSSLHAEITATVSYCINAANRREVLETAYDRLNEKSIRMLKVKMVNDQGEAGWFQVERVHAVEWTGVEWTGYNNTFHAVGQVWLTVRSIEPSGGNATGFQQAGYDLPRSAVNNLAHWAVPARGGPALLCVKSYELEWKSDAADRVFSKVG